MNNKHKTTIIEDNQPSDSPNMSETQEVLKKYERQVLTKYQIYNSLFLNLSIDINFTAGILIPLLRTMALEGFENGKSSKEIVEDFIQKHTQIKDDKSKFNLLFQMVKYIERQVLLFDCIEDAAFKNFKRGKLADALRYARNDEEENYTEMLKNKSVRIVFTAHPTQFYSEKVQLIMGSLREAIKKNDINSVNDRIQQLAYTPFINSSKPTPYEEAKNIIFYLRFVYYEAFGQLYHKICKALDQNPDFNPDLIQMGFWPGGDRDGNPFVTAETTLKVARLLRNTVMKCYYNHFKELSFKFTFKETILLVENLRERLYQQIFSDDVLIDSKDILSQLSSIRDIVVKEYNGLFLDLLDDFISRVTIFGDYFAALDIRQDSSAHIEVMEDIFRMEKNGDYLSLSEQQKLSFLTHTTLNLLPNNYHGLTRDTIENIYQIKDIQKANSEKGLHRYIISNTESVTDVMHVYGLFRFCGYLETQIPIDIVPLFETMAGMKASADIMESLYLNEAYHQHLIQRRKTQIIMLGFSDGTKDGGYIKANWEIYRTKQKLTDLSRKYGIRVIFFDGRGGPPARGGGNTYRFYDSQSPDIDTTHIQLTIQGQTITSIYGTHEHAQFNIEQLILAGHRKKNPSSAFASGHKDIMQILADKSYEKYTELKEHPLFTRYLEEITTLKYYGETNVGSRPSKRKTSQSLTLKDLRAIPFVGSWSLIKQNVPGYYGLGTAMETFRDNPSVLKNLYNENLFFQTLVDNSIMSMKKSFFELTRYLEKHPVYGEFWSKLHNEYLLSKKWALYLSDQKDLMEKEPVGKASLEKREHIVMPLLAIQQYALQSIMEESGDKDTLSKLVMRCLFGNINASRNSA